MSPVVLNSSFIVTPEIKSIYLVTHPQILSVVNYCQKTNKRNPVRPLVGSLYTQNPLISSLFGPLYYLTRDIRHTVSTWREET